MSFSPLVTHGSQEYAGLQVAEGSPRESSNTAGLPDFSSFYPNAGNDIVQSVCKAAALAALKEEPPFEEDAPNEAFQLLLAGQFIYLPQTHDTDGCHYDLNAATTKYDEAFDAFPNAGLAYPLAKPQWHAMLFDWVFDAGLDFADFMSDVCLCLSMIIDNEYVAVPSFFKIAYIGLTLVLVTWETVMAALKVYSKDGHWLASFRKRHGIIIFMVAVSKTLMLRCVALPFKVDNAAHVFSPENGGCNMNHNFELPIIGGGSRCVHDYSNCTGFLAKLPKVIIEDCVLLGFNLYMMISILQRISACGLISALLSLSVLRITMTKLYRYVIAVGRFSKYLQTHIDVGDPSGTAAPQLEELLQHPLRRFIVNMTRR